MDVIGYLVSTKGAMSANVTYNTRKMRFTVVHYVSIDVNVCGDATISEIH